MNRELILNTIIAKSNVHYIESDQIHSFCHQVAGHRNEIIKSYENKILKPCIKTDLFRRELRFYERVFAEKACHTFTFLRQYLPFYHGLVITGSNLNQSSKKDSYEDDTKFYIMLDDLTLHYNKPCILDIKIGLQTHEPTATEAKVKSQYEKFRYQSTLGFRISGVKIYDITTDTFKMYDKSFGRNVTPEDVHQKVLECFSNGVIIRHDIILQFIQKIEQLLNYFRLQTIYHYYCCSLLLIYEGNTTKCPHNGHIHTKAHKYTYGNTSLHLIDFAHIVDAHDELDSNFIYGLEKLLTILYSLLQ